ncbi:GTPase-activating protein gyp8 [Ceratocystis pirilliformis]|uniref:GTPase-activating protein gyp8 n=1 Tax=Ceratocystis pirilliformis TaxID=259994 RepID=A0ABR3ZH22_9PEZI
MGAAGDGFGESIKREDGCHNNIDRKDSFASDGESEYLRLKTAEIQEACNARDLPTLRRCALSKGGFLKDYLRQSAWPLLLGDDVVEDAKEHPLDSSWKDLEPHHDENQVQLDVNRSFVYYPNGKTETELSAFKQELSDLMLEVLRRHPYLHYFQGYHDICQVFVLVFPYRRARAHAVSRLSLLRIRDFMLSSLRPTVSQLHLIPDILAAADAPLRRHLAGVVDPFYALAGTLTMYAHNIERYGDIARLFDAMLAAEPAFSVYVFAYIILSRRGVLLDIPNDEQDVLHAVLSQVPQPLNVEGLISGTVALMEKYPPRSLPAWKRISAYSCLKTYSPLERCESMADAARNFKKQTSELEWQDLCERTTKALWKYRKPARAVCAAVAVGIFAIYLRKNPSLLNSLPSSISRVLFYR